MSSNSNNMSLEDKIVQTIKDTHLYSLVGDEDAIAKLVHRAITEALFKDRPDQTDGYGRVIKKNETPIVEAARVVAQKAVDKITEEILGEMLNNELVRKIIFRAIVDGLPAALNLYMQKQIHDTIKTETVRVNNTLVKDLNTLEHTLIQKGGLNGPVFDYSRDRFEKNPLDE